MLLTGEACGPGAQANYVLASNGSIPGGIPWKLEDCPWRTWCIDVHVHLYIHIYACRAYCHGESEKLGDADMHFDGNCMHTLAVSSSGLSST